MRQHRQNSDVSDIPRSPTTDRLSSAQPMGYEAGMSYQASSWATQATRGQSVQERNTERLSDLVCVIVMLIAMLAAWAVATSADAQAEAALHASLYDGLPKRPHVIDQPWPSEPAPPEVDDVCSNGVQR